jgi:cytochrome oxidase Cu insertion factor (SCO1/SenC/PrrC family)
MSKVGELDMTARRRNVRVLALLAALFFLPLLLSFVLYYGTSWRPAAQVNHGELISPVRPLPQVTLPVVEGPWPGFKGSWTLVYLGDGRCDEHCHAALTMSRQTRLALNNDMGRVQRLFLATGGGRDHQYLQKEHPGLAVLDASGPAASQLVLAFPADGASLSVFVVDPLGNLMMRYDARENPRGLLQDLQKLLRLSHIG